MRSRVLILAVLVVVAAVTLVAVAAADRSEPLPTVTAPELLAAMAEADGPEAVSGDVAWRNGLFGDLAAASGMDHVPAQSPLTSSGSGRIWVSDTGVRVESQGGGGDQVVVVNSGRRTAWVYDAAEDTAKKVTVTGEAPAETASPAPDAAMLTPDAIALFLQQVSRLAAVEVAGQTVVAGRQAYQLRMTPAADDTALGSVEAAVDGETMLPLQLDVYARGGVEPVLRYGFTSVSYEAIDPDLFTFQPPAGTRVTSRTVDGDRVRRELGAHGDAGQEPTGEQKARAKKQVRRAFLAREQVRDLVPYELAWARGYDARAFRWGHVLSSAGPLTGSGMPLMGLLAQAAGMTPRGASPADLAEKGGPASALLYGEGLGAIVLVQTETTPELKRQIAEARSASELLGSTSVNGAKALVVGTPLGGAIVWQQDGTTLVAAGMVPMSDLEAFAGFVR